MIFSKPFFEAESSEKEAVLNRGTIFLVKRNIGVIKRISKKRRNG